MYFITSVILIWLESKSCLAERQKQFSSAEWVGIEAPVTTKQASTDHPMMKPLSWSDVKEMEQTSLGVADPSARLMEYLNSSEEDIFSWDQPPETFGKEKSYAR